MTSRSAPRRGDAAELAMRRDVTMSRRSFMRSLSALSVTAGAGLDLAARASGADAAMALVLVAAFEAMLDGSWPRLKACRNCGWVFFDTSKNRSGSWCSMQICGNRTKTRAYRRRKSAEAA